MFVFFIIIHLAIVFIVLHITILVSSIVLLNIFSQIFAGTQAMFKAEIVKPADFAFGYVIRCRTHRKYLYLGNVHNAMH